MKNNNSSFDNTYTRRRTVEADTYSEVAITDIGHINESEIGLVIDVAEDKYLLNVQLMKLLILLSDFLFFRPNIR